MTADPMKNFSIALPFWARALLLAGIVGIVLGAGLIAWRVSTGPTTLSLAVGSFDGEAAKIAGIVADRLAATRAAVRLKIVPTDSVLDSAKTFATGKTDLAIVRADVGDLSQARSVALVNKSVLMILALPGSSLTSVISLASPCRWSMSTVTRGSGSSPAPASGHSTNAIASSK